LPLLKNHVKVFQNTFLTTYSPSP